MYRAKKKSNMKGKRVSLKHVHSKEVWVLLNVNAALGPKRPKFSILSLLISTERTSLWTVFI